MDLWKENKRYDMLVKSVGFEWDNKMLVSSANKIGTDLSFTK